MEKPRLPANEAERLRALAAYRILDTAPEQAFDGLAALAAHILGVPIVLVSVVDAQRQWFKSAHGLAETEVPRDVSLCGEVVTSGKELEVRDARIDRRFTDNPLVTGDTRVVFYAGMPLRSQDAKLEVVVADNGVGLPAGFAAETCSSVGMQVVCAWVEQIDAQLRIEQHEGTQFIVTFGIDG